MFDKVFLTPTRTEYVPYEKTVIEKRAPTDESIRLYDEIKEKAYKSILGSIQMSDNLLNVSAIYYEDFASLGKFCQYQLTLNGKEITGKIKVDGFIERTKIDILRKIVEHTAENIAVQIGTILLKDV